ncbi:MAG: hypothetical protein LCH53_03970 [Bacteroidetes bacterium]|nr:hypothetical protein [Bacteroidota bacterium]
MASPNRKDKRPGPAKTVPKTNSETDVESSSKVRYRIKNQIERTLESKFFWIILSSFMTIIVGILYEKYKNENTVGIYTPISDRNRYVRENKDIIQSIEKVSRIGTRLVAYDYINNITTNLDEKSIRDTTIFYIPEILVNKSMFLEYHISVDSLCRNIKDVDIAISGYITEINNFMHHYVIDEESNINNSVYTDKQISSSFFRLNENLKNRIKIFKEVAENDYIYIDL